MKLYLIITKILYTIIFTWFNSLYFFNIFNTFSCDIILMIIISFSQIWIKKKKKMKQKMIYNEFINPCLLNIVQVINFFYYVWYTIDLNDRAMFWSNFFPVIMEHYFVKHFPPSTRTHVNEKQKLIPDTHGTRLS